MEMEQSVPKRRHIKFRRRGFTQKKAYNIQNTAKLWNQEVNNTLDNAFAILYAEFSSGLVSRLVVISC